MNKKLIIFLALALLAVPAFAAQTRDPVNNRENETYFGNVGSAGTTTTGNSSYLILQNSDGSGSYTYVLWVDITGKLKIASNSTVASYASWPSGDLRAPNFPVGTTVGSQ